MRLNVFDLDGTLVDTPANTPENIAKYEKATGIPWKINKELAQQLTEKFNRRIGVRRGWWGRHETLEPPLVPDPAPNDLFISDICDRFLQSKSDPNVITLVLTGRHSGLKKQVLRVLDDGNLVKCRRTTDQSGKVWIENVDPLVQVYCLGEDGPLMEGASTKPPDTLPWKIWVINQFVALNPDIELVEIWEDRYEHMVGFYNTLSLNTIVHYKRRTECTNDLQIGPVG